MTTQEHLKKLEDHFENDCNINDRYGQLMTTYIIQLRQVLALERLGDVIEGKEK